MYHSDCQLFTKGFSMATIQSSLSNNLIISLQSYRNASKDTQLVKVEKKEHCIILQKKKVP